ncbi:Uma2 family endonuclease [Archangium lansingense]|uniref:Uma2 family endonuclease n=1 Tax=Archangium lansingense TaxID=2995310 RepID=A0ABT4ALF9_9BACT|nr:Uma2 family endonuclease [Archangium lansinium]MCY1082547.1 Uma2 family endonuclease [Archangium lansinium]
MGRHTDERGDAFPRAPTQEEWEAMGQEERDRVVDSLPGEVTWDEMAMPEGDRHFQGKVQAMDALRGYFKRQERKVYLGAELPIYYPGERRFAPDLLAVLDAEPYPRQKWVVSAEGKGLDWVMEVHVGGDRKKDAEYNVQRYARLGIPEYFIYDRARQRLEAYRLASPEAHTYVPMEQRQGRYVSRVLGLELQVEGDRLRFWTGTALLMESDELIARLEELLHGVQHRAEEDSRQLQDEVHRREQETRLRLEAEKHLVEETRRREEAERRLKELQAELERLEQRRD